MEKSLLWSNYCHRSCKRSCFPGFSLLNFPPHTFFLNPPRLQQTAATPLFDLPHTIMGKNWRGHGGGGGGGKGGGGGHGNDFSSCRGHAVVLGTCDAARERETSKELVNLLTTTIETLYPPNSNNADSESEEEEGEVRVDSIQDMLKNEINQIRNQRNTQTQAVMSINTGVKGIVLIKIVRKDICPVALVKAVFDQVKRDKLPLTRFVVRVIPLKLCCFPNEEELNESLKLLIDRSISLNEAGKCVIDEYVHTGAFKLTNKQKWSPPKSEAVSDAAGAAESTHDANEEETKNEIEAEVEDEQAAKKARTDDASLVVDEDAAPSVNVLEAVVAPIVPIQLLYTISFKARNHNTLNKDMLFKAAIKQMPKYARNDYRRPEVSKSEHVIIQFVCG